MKNFLTVQETAALLQVTPRTVTALINRGRFPGAHKIDPLGKTSHWRIPRRDIDAFLESQNKPVLANESI